MSEVLLAFKMVFWNFLEGRQFNGNFNWLHSFSGVQVETFNQHICVKLELSRNLACNEGVM
jgi:hypothetical protein